MTDKAWFLGIDLGTGSCKSVVIDENADILGFGVGEYAGSDAHDRWQEQNPRELLQAAIASVRNALARAGVDAKQCAGLSIGGALHSLLALDRHGEPLTGVITWADGRAVDQAEAMRRQPLAAQLYEQTGCPRPRHVSLVQNHVAARKQTGSVPERLALRNRQGICFCPPDRRIPGGLLPGGRLRLAEHAFTHLGAACASMRRGSAGIS